MTTLSRKVGTVTYSNLIAGITPPVHVSSGTIRKVSEEITYPTGTVFAKFSGAEGDGKLVILGTAAGENEILTPDCVLCEDVVVEANKDLLTTVYTAGCFNSNMLTLKDGYTMTEEDKDKLRERNIYLGIVFD